MVLHVDVENVNVSVIKSLLHTKEINFNAKAAGGSTPLYTAVSSTNIDAVATLFSDARTHVNACSFASGSFEWL